MLKKSEIVVGGLYAWDTRETDPKIGCNLFTIIEDARTTYGRLTVESLDGVSVFCCGEHCLIAADRAITRLHILLKMAVPKEGTDERWSYNREIKYLTLFKAAYDLHFQTKW